ncbi:MAG TPA: hypothetical protein VI233_12430 [Puia sp.]
MKRTYTLLTVAVVLMISSCSSSRTAQNTDDIYYSSGKSRVAASSNNDEYYSTAPSDNYIRMKAQDQARWSYFDDYNAYDSYYAPTSSWTLSAGYGYGYGFPGYGFGLGYGYGLGFWDPYFAWNSYYMWNSWYNPYFYNPYYGGGVFVGHGVAATGVYSHIRPLNSPAAYRNGLVRNVNGNTFSNGTRTYRPANSSYNNNSVNGRSTRMVNNNNTFYNNTNTNSYRPVFQPSSQPTRSYTPTGGGGGGGGFSRPGRH